MQSPHRDASKNRDIPRPLMWNVGKLNPFRTLKKKKSSCSAHHPAAHIILRRTSSFGPHPRAAHIILQRTSSPHIILWCTSSWAHIGAHRRAAHFVLQCTLSCSALHPAVHIIVRRTSFCNAQKKEEEMEEPVVRTTISRALNQSDHNGVYWTSIRLSVRDQVNDQTDTTDPLWRDLEKSSEDTFHFNLTEP
ncbi:unnamed protein product [Pleuronectes platessa]|uniref:Uncharacterized protein n=1 Tax=Pleuronectes platessa TaxID=8262 RepID=A0A9N7W2E4_PLEPL|nr:unnamed protein product [Pleuronectes platessa]